MEVCNRKKARKNKPHTPLRVGVYRIDSHPDFWVNEKTAPKLT